MIAIYLLPFPVRGVRAPYLWVFYKWLTVLRAPARFIVGADYVRNPADFAAERRWELGDTAQAVYGYRPPDAAGLARHELRFLADEVFATLLADCRGNPVELFRRLLTERLPVLEAALAEALSGVGANGEALRAVVTWCNCPSLSAAAAARGIRVIHLEVGPLRAPLYRPTAYLDFSGVNGNTEAARRYARLPPAGRDIDAGQLRRFFFLKELPAKDPVGRVGLALQVEDDSNLVAFGNGFDNQAAVTHVRLRYGDAGPIAVRSHPGSLFKAAGDWFEADRSYDSLEFIQRCRRIVTINSSLGLEALLLGTPVTMLGDASFRFIVDADDETERRARLAFYLFAYLIPEALQFDADYLRFRLGDPGEPAIVARHLRHYLDRPECGDGGNGGESVWELIEAGLAACR